MKTKICSGKHGCGKELPIDNFYYQKRKRISKKGIIHYYIEYQSICKICKSKLYKKRYPSKREHILKVQKEYKKTEGFREKRRVIERRYAQNHPEKMKVKRKRCADSGIKELKNWYVKLSLREIFINNDNITPELIEAKRNQLKLYRYAKEQCK